MRAKLVMSLFAALMISGCCTTSDVKVVEKIKYVRDDIPAEMLTIPQHQTNLNVDDPTLTQKDVGMWIINEADYSTTITKMLEAIKSYQDKRDADIEKMNKDQQGK